MPINVDVRNNFAPPTLTVERVIDRYGIMNLTPAQRSTFNGQLFFDLVRAPANRNVNYRFEPPREFFGYVMAMRSNRVLAYYPLEFPNQRVYEWLDNATRWQLSQQCFLSAILATQDGPAQDPFVVSQHIMPACPVAQFRFRLWGNAAAKFTWVYEDNTYPCAPGSRPTTGSTANPTAPPSVLPPNTPIVASPAYTGPNDGGLTFNPGPPPAPAVPDNKTYRFSFTISYTDASTGQPVTNTIPFTNYGCPTSFYGPFGQGFVKAGPNGGQLVAANGFSATGQPQEYAISGEYTNILGSLTLSNFQSQACP